METIRDFVNRHLRYIVRILEVTILAAWIVSQFVPGYGGWLSGRGVIDLVVLVLVAELIVAAGRFTQPVALFDDQVQSSQELIQRIKKMEPSVAKLIGLSGGKREDLLKALTDAGWKVRLLAQHPEAAMNEVLKNHLREMLRQLNDITFSKCQDSVEFRLYRRPCFLRGTKVGDDYVALGWYACGEGQYGLFGHRNPLVRTTQGGAECLKRFFDEAFDYLWEHEDTISFTDYLMDPK